MLLERRFLHFPSIHLRFFWSYSVLCVMTTGPFNRLIQILRKRRQNLGRQWAHCRCYPVPGFLQDFRERRGGVRIYNVLFICVCVWRICVVRPRVESKFDRHNLWSVAAHYRHIMAGFVGFLVFRFLSCLLQTSRSVTQTSGSSNRGEINGKDRESSLNQFID